MDLGSEQERSLTMPMPMQSYGSIHESSKYKMQLGAPAGLHGVSSATAVSNGTPVLQGSASVAPPPQPPTPVAPVNSTAQANATALVEPTGPLPSKRPVKYRECLKNHAASIGGHALDGCGEFMPGGEEGSLEALKCAACGCHRNFHRREVEGEVTASAVCNFCAYGPRPQLHSVKDHDDRRRFAPLVAIQPPHPPLALPPPPSPSVAVQPRSLTPLHMQPLHSPPDLAVGDDHSPELAAVASTHPHNHSAHPMLSAMQAHHQYHHFGSSLRKRFRTKFSSEQKDRMFDFAEKLGWRIQKHDEAVVHQFCADVGVKRHVFKVWMHNNKNTFGKKILPSEGGIQYLENGSSSPTTSNGVPTEA